MKSNTKLAILVIAVSMLSGCTLADLRSQQVMVGEQKLLSQEGRRLLSLAVWRNDKSGVWDGLESWQIEAADVWESGIIRRFTPLTDNTQTLRFDFDVSQISSSMTFMDGKRAGETVGVDSIGEFLVVDGERSYQKVSKLGNYLEPVRDYFFWPQTLINHKTILHAGDGEVNGKEYHIVFVSDGDSEPSPATDQYVVWLNKDNLRIDYIEFTLRTLLKSYRGVAQYLDYRDVNGIVLPHQIKLSDKVGSEKYSHRFDVIDMKFSLPKRDLGFAMEIKPFTLDLGLLR